MAISKEILDELLKDYKGPDDITGPDGLLKQLTKAVIERAMQAELTEHWNSPVLVDNYLSFSQTTGGRENGRETKNLPGGAKAQCFGAPKDFRKECGRGGQGLGNPCRTPQSLEA